jgi:hypothetical protein
MTEDGRYVFGFEFLRPDGPNPTEVLRVDVVPEVFNMVPG